ncbi:MAG: glycosyltransferase family 2 protein [Planctomycetes bacterium]|nr:glycosyltransferase family 2 protein [Planctomycetota bacterium]
MSDRATLTVVIPIYNEQENLPELFRRLRAVFDQLTDLDCSVLYIDDGSRDESMRLMVEQNRQDARFRVAELSRNFGHQPALTAGLMLADADAVVLMDGDMQDPPELIPELVICWRQGADVVRAVRRDRAERGLKRIGFELFYKIIDWISDFPLPNQTGIFGLLSRQAVNELNRMPEKNRFLPGLRAWIGFDQRTVFYDRQLRAAGEPKQNIWRLVRYAMDGFLSFSYKPLRLMFGAGVIVSLCGFVLAVSFVLKRLLGYETAPTGFTTLITVVLFLGGVQLMAMGLLGEYLGRIYDEVKRRPMYIIKQVHGDPRGHDSRNSIAVPEHHGQTA